MMMKNFTWQLFTQNHQSLGMVILPKWSVLCAEFSFSFPIHYMSLWHFSSKSCDRLCNCPVTWWLVYSSYFDVSASLPLTTSLYSMIVVSHLPILFSHLHFLWFLSARASSYHLSTTLGQRSVLTPLGSTLYPDSRVKEVVVTLRIITVPSFRFERLSSHRVYL